MKRSREYITRFDAPDPSEWTARFKPDQPVLVSRTTIRDGDVTETADETCHTFQRSWNGKLYVDACPVEGRTWTVRVTCDTIPPGPHGWRREIDETYEVRVGPLDVLYANLREDGVSTVAVDRV